VQTNCPTQLIHANSRRENLTMSFAESFAGHQLVLTEGSTYERMRRNPDVTFDPEIKHGGMIYSESGRAILEAAHRDYIEVALRHSLPMIVNASTWRASKERIDRSVFAGKPVNQDNVTFSREIAASASTADTPLYVAGVMACRADAYRPDLALGVDEAVSFHEFQVAALTEAGPDYLVAATLPALSEARGIARCLEESGLPYMLSFVVRGSGTLLDGTPLRRALDTIDSERARAPEGYMINCVHPSVLEQCLDVAGAEVAGRILGLRANTATLSPEELSDTDELITTPPEELARCMRAVQGRGLRVLGGCCGTDSRHIDAIATLCKAPAPPAR
jgi:homocysteine S-methyltransferase